MTLPLLTLLIFVHVKYVVLACLTNQRPQCLIQTVDEKGKSGQRQLDTDIHMQKK